jgi:hypothetical protein
LVELAHFCASDTCWGHFYARRRDNAISARLARLYTVFRRAVPDQAARFRASFRARVACMIFEALSSPVADYNAAP